MTNLIEAMARAMCSCMCRAYVADCSDCDSWANECDYARAALTAIEAAGYDLVLRQHRDMGPGFTHHDGPDCACFAAAPKVTE